MSGTSTTGPQLTTRRAFLTGSAALAAGLAIYSGEIARHEIETTHLEIPIAGLPAGFDGMRVVQLSDIHLDEYTEPFFLERVIRHVNTLAPDLVLLTGDFVTRGALTFVAANHAAYRCAEILQTLTCTERYACLGNHDVTVGTALVTDALESRGTPVLRNRYLAMDRRGDRLWIAGTADPDTDIPDLDLAVPAEPRSPVILMVHAPDFADDVRQHPRGAGVSLMLSGHSHGGQVRLPFLGPLVLPRMGRKYVAGSFRFESMQLYVNRGIGTVGLPFRLNCPPEITELTLKTA